MYGLLEARWYDPFRIFWTWATCRRAEKALTEKLKTLCTDDTVIVDLGCGTGFNIARLLNNKIPFKRYIGLDASEHMLGRAQSKFPNEAKLTFSQHDIIHLTDVKADVIICTWVLSHLQSPVETIAQWTSALHPGGTLLCICLSKPRWYVDIWFRPLAFASQCRYVDAEQLLQLENTSELRQYSAGLVTLVILGDNSVRKTTSQ